MSSVALLILLLLALLIPQCSSARHLRTGAHDHLLSQGFEKASLDDDSTATLGVLQAKGSEMEEEDKTGNGAVHRRSLLQGSWNHGAGVVVKDHAGFDVDYVGPRTHSPSHN